MLFTLFRQQWLSYIFINDNGYVSLDPQARSDLVSYLSGTGLILESIGVRRTKTEDLFLIKFPKSGLAYGWRRRIAEKLKIDMTAAIKFRNIVNQLGSMTHSRLNWKISKRLGSQDRSPGNDGRS